MRWVYIGGRRQVHGPYTFLASMVVYGIRPQSNRSFGPQRSEESMA